MICADYFIKDECTECNRNKIITLRDAKNPQKFTAENPDAKCICTVKVDGCFDKHFGKQEKCDFLLLNCTDNVSFVIELKGSDLGKAISQADQTLTTLFKHLRSGKICVRIILNKTPSVKMKQSLEKKLRQRLDQHNGRKSPDWLKSESHPMSAPERL